MFTLPKLPYAYDALEPAMSAETLKLHHDKHHKTYIDKTDTLAKEAGKADFALEELIAAARWSEQELFNNAAQAWNHAFFWHSMSPDDLAPYGALDDAISASFGSLSQLKEKFVTQGTEHFGSGWVWLLADEGGAISVAATHDAETPVGKGGKLPLLVCDLWEHAYYLDKKNDREAYLEDWFETLANWEFAASQLTAAKRGAKGYAFPEPVEAA